MVQHVRVLIDDPAPLPRYKKGDTATVIQSFDRLTSRRRWHYFVKWHHKPHFIDPTHGTRRDLSSKTYFTKDQVEEIPNVKNA